MPAWEGSFEQIFSLHLLPLPCCFVSDRFVVPAQPDLGCCLLASSLSLPFLFFSAPWLCLLLGQLSLLSIILPSTSLGYGASISRVPEILGAQYLAFWPHQLTKVSSLDHHRLQRSLLRPRKKRLQQPSRQRAAIFLLSRRRRGSLQVCSVHYALTSSEQTTIAAAALPFIECTPLSSALVCGPNYCLGTFQLANRSSNPCSRP